MGQGGKAVTAFGKMARMFDGNVGRIASAMDGFGGPSFVGYNSIEKRIRIGKESDDCWSYYNPVTSVVSMTEGKGGRIDVLFERHRKVRECADGSSIRMRLGGMKRWYDGEMAGSRALKDAAEFLGIPPRFLQSIYEEAER